MLELIKEIRKETGAGIVEIKKAIEEVGEDKEKIFELLRKSGLQKAEKKSDRVASDGTIVSYVHADGKSGAMVKLLCETDFVAKNDEFLALANDIAMHVVAMKPTSVEDLYDQSFVKNPEMTVEEVIKGKIAVVGENIKVDEFVLLEF